MPLVEYRTQIDRVLAGSPADPYVYARLMQLASASDYDAAAITVDGWPSAQAGGYLVIDPYGAICEVRRVTAVNGAVLTLETGLTHQHAQYAPVFWHAGPINALWFGAVADGTTDDAPALQLALDAAETIGGGAVLIPAGSYGIGLNASLSVASGVSVIGDGPGATTLIVQRDTDVATFDLDGVTDVMIAGLTIYCGTVRAAGPVKTSVGVAMDGAENVTLERIAVTGLFRGFAIGIDGGSNNSNVTLRNCRATQPNAFATAYQCDYGCIAYYCDGLTLDNCVFNGFWLDGIKINRNCTNVRVLNCSSCDNGVSYDYGLNGQGIDLYPGGNSVLIVGGEFSRNKGGGIYTKASSVNMAPDSQGVPRGLRVVDAICKANTGAGLGIENPGDPLVFQVSIVGGLFEDNSTFGIYLAARQVTIEGAICRKNGYAGIEVAAASYGITLIGVQIIANSQNSAGTYHAINVSAQDVQIVAPYINGADGDEIGAYGDDSALTKYHNRSIYIGANADNVQVIGGWYRNQNSAADHISSNTDSTGIIVNRPMTRTPEAYSAYSAGSLVVDVTTGYAYLKTTAAGTNTGWQRIATTDML